MLTHQLNSKSLRTLLKCQNTSPQGPNFHISQNAHHVFDKIPRRDPPSVSNSMLTYIHQNLNSEALDIFKYQLHYHYPHGIDEDLMAVAIKACCRGILVDPRHGNAIHAFTVCSGFAKNLRRFPNVFLLHQDGLNNGFLRNYVTLNPKLETPEDRTSVVGNVIRCLGELIPGIRNELYPVVGSFGEQAFFSLESVAAPYFGIKVYGVQMNGYVEKGRQEFLWLAKRIQAKPTFLGMLDHLVSGGLPHGISCDENMIKECEEEEGIPKSISKNIKSVGVVSYIDINGYSFKRDVLFCYDLKLPKDFIPSNEDGEVESFKLVPVSGVANVVRRTHLFKPNCTLVIIDFLFRHGYINPRDVGYLKLLQNLRSGECS